jgi:hypothetical protein
LFKDHARAAGLLAKAGDWDESKHPRVPAGSPGGGQFQGGQGGGVVQSRSVTPGIGRKGGSPMDPPEVPKKEPFPFNTSRRYQGSCRLCGSIASGQYNTPGISDRA